MTTSKQKKSIVKTNDIEGEIIPLPDEVTDKRISEINAKFSNGLPYNTERLITESRTFLTQANDCMLEVGKRLILIKEHVVHGEFIKSVEKIGIGKRTAQRAMNVAVRLTGNKKSIADLGISKAIDMLALDDDSLEELAEGGTIAGKTLDEFDQMTVQELRDTLRKNKQKHKDDIEAKAQILSNKNKKIDEQAEQLNKLSNITKDWSGLLGLYTKDITEISSTTIAQMNRIKELSTKLGTDEIDEQVKLEAETFLEEQLKFMYEHLLDASAIASKHLGIPMVTDNF
ncbi:MAG: hypothetical protein QM504_06525 [Pseudomonadota bacterium]